MSKSSPHPGGHTGNGRPLVALLGNPNTGKTTLFNALTGLRQKIANYPGVTVERHSGTSVLNQSSEAELLDLPGTYSLAARTIDEAVASRVLVCRMPGERAPAAVVLVLDASNLERNLYLGGQVLEFGLPTVVALTMTDVAAGKGMKVDPAKLSEALGVPVVAVNGRNGEGIDQFKAALSDMLAEPHEPPMPAISYPGRLRPTAEELAQELTAVSVSRGDGAPKCSFPEALRVLSEADGPAEQEACRWLGDTVKPLIDAARERAELGDRPPVLAEAASRHGWSRSVAAASVELTAPTGDDLTSKLDRILTHRFVGTLIFLSLMGLVFQAVFSWAGPLMDLIETVFGMVRDGIAPALGEGLFASFLLDGVIAGIEGVVVFLPQIMILFLFIAVLEDSGYMARAAFLADRLLRPFGLTGRSFIPMMSGFACAIPAIMATRSIPNRATRFATIMVTPLMSCSARLPVYSLMILAFVPDGDFLPGLGIQAATMLGMYLLGVVVAIPTAWIFRRFAFKGISTPFSIELSTYKMPRWGGVMRTVLDRGRVFVVSAGTIIFAAVVIIWAMGTFPRSDAVIEAHEAERNALVSTHEAELAASPVETRAALEEAHAKALADVDNREEAALLEESLLGQIGHAIEPAFRPLGWDWRISTAAVASFPAREVVVGVLGTLFALGGDIDTGEDEGFVSLRDRLTAAHHPDGRPLFGIATALSLMIFFALCMQCGATVAAIKREMNSWKWAVLAFVYMTALAYIFALIAYQIASAMGG